MLNTNTPHTTALAAAPRLHLQPHQHRLFQAGALVGAPLPIPAPALSGRCIYAFCVICGTLNRAR